MAQLVQRRSRNRKFELKSGSRQRTLRRSLQCQINTNLVLVPLSFEVFFSLLPFPKKFFNFCLSSSFFLDELPNENPSPPGCSLFLLSSFETFFPNLKFRNHPSINSGPALRPSYNVETTECSFFKTKFEPKIFFYLVSPKGRSHATDSF